MRASFTSSTRSGTLFHVRVTPPAVGLGVERVGIGLPPISASITAPNALADTQWAHGYSGCIGVVMSGVQPVSCMRAGLPPPLRIAVIGRQNWYVYSRRTATPPAPPKAWLLT